MKAREWALALTVMAALGAGVARSARATDFTLTVHGQLDATASSRGKALEFNLFNAGASMFDAYRLRLFLEGAATPKIQVYTQLVLDEVNSHNVYGAYLMYTPWSERDLHVIAGKIPWMIGTYGPRTYSDKKPLIGTPLIYQYHTTLRSDVLVPDVDALLAVQGRGQSGFSYTPTQTKLRGMPVIYDFCWDAGVAVNGSAAPLEYAVAITAGTPSMMEPSQDNNEGKSVMGRIGFQPIPALRIGASGSYGPYLASSLDPQLPAGKTANDYMQKLAMADFALETGHLSLISEGYLNQWMTPTVGNLGVAGYYGEARIGIASTGAWLAGRWESMRFTNVTSSTGETEPWNYDIDRLETGVGYRVARGAIVKAVYQANYQHDDGSISRYDLYAAQMSVNF
ncbi:MAG TPA: hypothetical protein VMJ70_12835 [Candidatus Sulfotelmatobacter sp.]|nr:hypothetical protein [Candidatus Sulfotelmatobacter sp.]